MGKLRVLCLRIADSADMDDGWSMEACEPHCFPSLPVGSAQSSAVGNPLCNAGAQLMPQGTCFS